MSSEGFGEETCNPANNGSFKDIQKVTKFIFSHVLLCSHALYCGANNYGGCNVPTE